MEQRSYGKAKFPSYLNCGQKTGPMIRSVYFPRSQHNNWHYKDVEHAEGLGFLPGEHMLRQWDKSNYATCQIQKDRRNPP